MGHAAEVENKHGLHALVAAQFFANTRDIQLKIEGIKHAPPPALSLSYVQRQRAVGLPKPARTGLRQTVIWGIKPSFLRGLIGLDGRRLGFEQQANGERNFGLKKTTLVT